jgi:hypothetical protein
MGWLGRLGPTTTVCNNPVFGALSEASSHHVGAAVEQQGDNIWECIASAISSQKWSMAAIVPGFNIEDLFLE